MLKLVIEHKDNPHFNNNNSFIYINLLIHNIINII